MKKLTALLMVLLLLAVSFVTPGCTTTSGGSGPVVDQQTLNDAAIALRSAARVAATVAMQEKPEARQYIVLSVTVLDQFAVGENYEPGKLVEALKPVLKEVKDAKVAIAINTTTDLYEVFYGRYVKAKLYSNTNAYMFVKALRDGAAQALEIVPPAPATNAPPSQ